MNPRAPSDSNGRIGHYVRNQLANSLSEVGLPYKALHNAARRRKGVQPTKAYFLHPQGNHPAARRRKLDVPDSKVRVGVQPLRPEPIRFYRTVPVLAFYVGYYTLRTALDLLRKVSSSGSRLDV